MKIEKKLILLLFIGNFSCGYLPGVNYFLPADFTRYEGHTLEMGDTMSSLLKSDSTKINLTVSAWVPSKSRSRRLGIIWANLDLEISDEKAFDKSIILLDSSDISLVFNSKSLKGTLKAPGNNTQRILKLSSGLVENENSIIAEFRIDKKSMPKLAFQIHVDLKYIKIGQKKIRLLPVIMEFNPK